MKKSFYTFTLVVIAVLLVCMAIFTEDKTKTNSKTSTKNDAFSPEAITELFTESPTPKPTKTPEPTTTPTVTLTAEQKAQEEESFKSTCREYADDTYKRLMREDTKSGTRICLKVEVLQKMEGMYTEYYRVCGTKDSLYEEYVIYDYREDKSPRIIVGDKLTVYATFVNIGRFERSITGTTVEIPTLNAKYIEIEDY